MVRYEHSAAIHPHLEELHKCLDRSHSDVDLDPGVSVADRGQGQECDLGKFTHEDAEVKAGSEAFQSQYPRENGLGSVINGRKPNVFLFTVAMDVQMMLFLGFGFLMTFLKRFGYSALIFTMSLVVISVEWAILVFGFTQIDETNTIYVDWPL